MEAPSRNRSFCNPTMPQPSPVPLARGIQCRLVFVQHSKVSSGNILPLLPVVKFVFRDEESLGNVSHGHVGPLPVWIVPR